MNKVRPRETSAYTRAIKLTHFTSVKAWIALYRHHLRSKFNLKYVFHTYWADMRRCSRNRNSTTENITACWNYQCCCVISHDNFAGETDLTHALHYTQLSLTDIWYSTVHKIKIAMRASRCDVRTTGSLVDQTLTWLHEEVFRSIYIYKVWSCYYRHTQRRLLQWYSFRSSGHEI